jgi:hypothetical protein
MNASPVGGVCADAAVRPKEGRVAMAPAMTVAVATKVRRDICS